jgi:hypothetical protein
VDGRQKMLIWVNVVGGLAVLGSYANGLVSTPNAGDVLWGGVPLGLRPLYTGSMLLAAVGYFPFTGYLLFGVDPDRVRIAGRLDYGCFVFLYALILFPSALWMPLTFTLRDGWNPMLWIVIRLVLALVGIGSLALLAGLLALTPRPRGMGYALAVAGAVAFCVQTALLDACVWPAFFPPG